MKKRKERIDRGIKARSEDIFALCSWREMLYLSAPRLIPILAFLILPLVLNPYWQKVLLSVAVFALLAISWVFRDGRICLRDFESLFRLASFNGHSCSNHRRGCHLYCLSVARTAVERHLLLHGYPHHSINAGPRY